MEELQDKSLMLLFGFILEAKVGEKFVITQDSLTTINKAGEEKVIPIERINVESKSFFVFKRESMITDSEIKIIRTKDNLFVFGVESMKSTLKANKDKVKSKDGIWFIKQDEISRAALFAINKTNDKEQI